MAKRKLWTRSELILSLNLYLKLPFGKINSTTPEIIGLAKLIGRTADAVSMRLSNFASVDPYHQKRGIKGLTGGLKQVQPIWNEFENNKEDLLFESERILAEKQNLTLEQKFPDALQEAKQLKGEDKLRLVKTRVNQSIFREIVTGNYEYKCAISGIDIPQFLVASHIIPWSQNKDERLNPENGICLSALLDKAYDKGFIGITQTLTVIVSKELLKYKNHQYFPSYFESLPGTKINLPTKYKPRKEFLQYHLDTIFLG